MLIKSDKIKNVVVTGGYVVILWFIFYILNNSIYRNITNSEPLGYYFVWNKPKYNTHDLVLVCVNERLYSNVLHQLGVPKISGECKNNMPFLLKKIVAQSGDTIVVTTDGIYINSALYKNSKAIAQYHGINLYPQKDRVFKLKKDEFFLMGETPTSYDSRYIGVVKLSQIYKRAVFIHI